MVLVTVIMPVLNGERYIRQALKSILEQSHTNLEVVVIDDGSTDDTAGAIKNLNDARICYQYQANEGISNAINKGLRLSKGELIAHCDADDLWDKHKLEFQVKHMNSNPDIILSGTWASIIDENGLLIGRHRHVCESDLIKLKLGFDNPFVHSSIIYRRCAAVSIGGYRSDADVAPPEDYDFITRMAVIGKTENLKALLTAYRHHSHGISKREARLISRNKANISRFYLAQITEAFVPVTVAQNDLDKGRDMYNNNIKYYCGMIGLCRPLRKAGYLATWKSFSYFMILVIKAIAKAISAVT